MITQPIAIVEEPRPVPFCAYPTAANRTRHGTQPLPASLPRVDWARARPWRSRRYTTVAAERLMSAQVIKMARVVASSFTRREPQTRHLQPPLLPSADLGAARHTDPFGSDSFGSWNTETIMYCFIRLCLLTDPTSPASAIETNPDVLAHSLAIVDRRGDVIGGALDVAKANIQRATAGVPVSPRLTSVVPS